MSLPKGVAELMTQGQVVRESISYIKSRMNGEIVPLKTFSPWLDEKLSYIEPNTTITISARSGGGKSTLSKNLVHAIMTNAERDGMECVGLSFNFEMLAHKTVGRKLSSNSNLALSTIYSVDTPLDKKLYDMLINKYAKDLLKVPIYYVEEPQTYTDIGTTIKYYWEKLAKDKVFIVEIDHAMITKGKAGDAQKDRVDCLMEELNICKKYIASRGGKVVFLVLSQMNRDIIRSERILNPVLHYPNTSDLFGSSAIEFFSDYIIVAHSPARLNISEYTDNKFPTILTEASQKTTNFIYFHILKNRDGVPDAIVPFLDRLHRFEFEGISKQEWSDYHTTFKQSGICYRRALPIQPI